MFSKKSLMIVTLSALMVFAGYTSLTFGISEKCLAFQAIGCLQISEKCLILCNITLDKSYRLQGDVPILVVREHGTSTVVIMEEMEYQGSTLDCDEYESRPEVPCETPYDVAIYINDTSNPPILTQDGIVCP